MIRRAGFTLGEMLVTVALIAVLAAVVVPAIGTQLQKRDPQRVADDVVGVREAVQAFVSDIRKYPASITQLDTIIDTLHTPLAYTNVTPRFGISEVNRWRGPYLNRDTTSGLNTGFGLRMKAAFDVDTLGQSGTVNTSSGTAFMVLAIPMMVGGSNANDQTSMLRLDSLFDDGSLSTGSFRYRICASTGCSGSADTLKYLLMPLY